jgi:uncharacterized protein
MAKSLQAVPRDVRPWTVLGAAVVVTAAVVSSRVWVAVPPPALETFVLIFTSIVIEALPFVLLGAVVAAAIEVLVPPSVFERVARWPVAVQLPAAACGGVAFPVCECGSVPVARRLMARGMHPAAGITFMLAAPILNPVVLASTALAYRGRGAVFEMVAGRAVLGLVVAVAAGWALGGQATQSLLRRDEEAPAAGGSAGRRLVDHIAADFFFMGRFVVLGSAIAALLQTLVPQRVVAGVTETPLVGSLALMALAFVLSLCSEADAFVAASFVQFPLGAHLAFLVLGPAVDVKLSVLYGATFGRRFVAHLLLVAVPVVLAGSLWFEVVVR